MQILMHGHHLKLLSVVKSKADRIGWIKKNKPARQQKLRLRLLQVVPLRLLPKDIVRMAKVLERSFIAVSRMDSRLDRELAREEKGWIKANIAWYAMERATDRAAEAQCDFFDTCDKHRDELEALHKKLCLSKHPDCPWDGERILPDEG